MKKLLVFGVIVLFLGVAIAPSINANISKASVDSELVEITTEVCGLNGGKQTVELTQEEAAEVEALFDSIRERLNNTETREEAEQIFKEAVVELDKYGLLGGLSVKQAQRLVTGGYQNLRVMKLMEKLNSKNQGINEINNLLCLVAGQTTYTIRMSFPTLGILGFISFLYYIQFMAGFVWPVSIFSVIYFGYDWLGHWYGQLGANGWVSTRGLNGIKSWEGNNLYGYLPNLIWKWNGNLVRYRWYGGVAGFTGIIIKFTNNEISFLGSALKVKLGTGHP